MTHRLARGLLLLMAALPARLAAQDEATVEVLANLLAAEDARRFDESVFRTGLAQPDSSVRQVAAMALGRLRDPAGLPLLVQALRDPDSTVQAVAAFAIGQLGSPEGVDPLIQRASGERVARPVGLEIVTALARLGGERAARYLAEILGGGRLGGREDGDLFVRRAVQEAWRLGDLAPIEPLLGYTTARDDDTRIGAVYSLARLRAKAAAPRLLDALSDRHPLVRQAAARALTRAYADTAGLAPETVADLLVRASGDLDAGVRIQALRSLATFRAAARADRVIGLLDDPVPNVAVQAAEVLGEMPSPAAAEGLRRVLAGKSGFARKKAALRSLARVDSMAFLTVESSWRTSPSWRERAVAAEAWTLVRPAGRPEFLRDPDSRVVAAALAAWGQRVQEADPAFVATCRELLGHPDAAVRSLAADGIARAADPADIPALVAAVKAARPDSFPDAALSALRALVAIGRGSPEARRRVDTEALAALPVPGDYQLRRWAESEWPAAAAAWGPAFPIQTGRSLEDYRGIVRRFLLGTSPDRYPEVTVEIEQVGSVKLELFGAEAPLTVAQFLRLVDRRFFDGMRWHRVVPNFVVQTGDPRGDGWGGPGTVLRDEITRRRYGAYVVGLALAGPDTGGSQWFITLSPQPHLDGRYPAFGRVTDGVPALLRVTEGDVIRTVRR
ncbi:MAG TPA: HEAT repeat domain-containing protein [Gemmatimonadales bacterium]|nr:HEAT repeat domain-containing protein [Gemmatimonadales bacterium]